MKTVQVHLIIGTTLLRYAGEEVKVRVEGWEVRDAFYNNNYYYYYFIFQASRRLKSEKNPKFVSQKISFFVIKKP